MIFQYAGIAQSVEQLIRNQQVAGSSPVTSSKKTHPIRDAFFYDWVAFFRSGTMAQAIKPPMRAVIS